MSQANRAATPSPELAGVVTEEHPDDPARPQVAILFGNEALLETPVVADTRARDWRGVFTRTVVESVDPDSVELDPLTVL